MKTFVTPTRAAPYAAWISDNLAEFQPTHVIFNDAFANVVTAMLPVSLKSRMARVEVVHTLEQLPVGPFAGGISGGGKSREELPLMKKLDGIVTVSKAVQKYAKLHCDLDTEMIPNHAWSYKDKDTGGWPRYRQNFSKANVVMINPAIVKGFDIFLGMAKENSRRAVEKDWSSLLNKPVHNFIAYTSWGSKPQMIEDLKDAGVK